MTVQLLRLGEGGKIRALRLDALSDAPHAFGSTFAREAEYPAEHWDALAEQSESGDAASDPSIQELTMTRPAQSRGSDGMADHDAVLFDLDGAHGTEDYDAPGRQAIDLEVYGRFASGIRALGDASTRAASSRAHPFVL